MVGFLGKMDWLMCCRIAAMVYMRDLVGQPPSQVPLKAILILSRQKSIRGFGSDSSSALHGRRNAEFVRVLSSEMVLVRDAYKSLKEKCVSKLAPFSLQDNPGLRHTVLHRAFKQEDITIKCVHETSSHGQSHHKTREDDPYAEKKLFCEGLLKMNIKICKGLKDAILEIDCTFAERDLYFERIASGDTNDEKRHSYAGPCSGNAADEFQVQFEQFLAVRAVLDQVEFQIGAQKWRFRSQNFSAATLTEMQSRSHFL